MTFEETITKSITDQLTNGTIEKIVQDKLEKAIGESIDRVFGYSGKCHDLIDKKIEEVMTPTIEKHNFNDYLTKLDETLTTIVNSTTLADNKTILENFQNCMTEMTDKVISIEKLFDTYNDFVAENVDTNGLEPQYDDGETSYENVMTHMTFEMDEPHFITSSFDNATITFTCDHDDDEKLTYKINIYKLKEKEEWSIFGTDTRSIDIMSLRYINDFEILLSKIKRSLCTIKIDETELETEIEPKDKPEWTLN